MVNNANSSVRFGNKKAWEKRHKRGAKRGENKTRRGQKIRQNG